MRGTGNGASQEAVVRRELRVASLAEPISHYTDAVHAGPYLFVSGCAPTDGEGAVVGRGDVVAQARQVFDNMRQVLEHAGGSFSDVVKVTVYLTDIDDREAIDVVRRQVFGDRRPASTLIEVSRLALDGMAIEVEAVAFLPDAVPEP